MSDSAAQPREDDPEGTDTASDPADADGTGAPDATGDETRADDAPIGSVSTGAEAVVAALETAGVETAFGVQGGAIMPVYDALFDSSVDHLMMAHEQGAAHAADAYGIVAGEPGVCLATSGPGATNLVTGIADADMDSDAMLALTGQVPTEFVGNDAFQETDTVGVTRPVTKHNYFAGEADAVGDVVGEAFTLADVGRPGPTLVDLPKDVTQADTESTPGPVTAPPGTDPNPNADPDAVERAARAIEDADRPLCLFGGGVIKGEASDAARTFARTCDIPFTTTMPWIGSFP